MRACSQQARTKFNYLFLTILILNEWHRMSPKKLVPNRRAHVGYLLLMIFLNFDGGIACHKAMSNRRLADLGSCWSLTFEL
jgi:hypothetical protein